MIAGFIGKLGSGKSLSLVREAYKSYCRGKRIMANLHLNFPYEHVDFNKLYEMAQSGEEMKDLVICLDEIHIMLDSRSSISKPSKVMTFWLNQTRKMGVKLLYTTQYLHQVDRRLRSGTDIIVYCEGIKITKRIGGETKEFFVCQNEIVFGDEFKKELFVGNDYYHLYDTREVIQFSKEHAREREEPETEEPSGPVEAWPTDDGNPLKGAREVEE